MRKTQNAFTLIELLVTLSVMSILIAVAVPNFRDQIKNNRSDALAEGFLAEINRARSEAIRRPALVSMCPSLDGVTCGGTWKDGFITFVDGAAAETSPATAVTLVNGAPLGYWRPPESDVSISVEGNNGAATFLRFTRLGTLANVDGVMTIKAKTNSCTGKNLNSMKISLSGSVTNERLPCSVITL